MTQQNAALFEQATTVSVENLPYSLESEMAVLGCMILSGGADGAIEDARDALDGPGAFFDDRHGAIYEAILDVYERTGSIDLIQIHEAMRSQKDRVDQAYLVELAGSVPSATNLMHYARVVSNAHTRRKLMELCAGTMHRIKYERIDTQDELGKLLDEAESGIFSLVSGIDRGGDQRTVPEILHSIRTNMESNQTGVTGIRTGLDDLDAMTCGLQAGDMVIIGARPSMGKTAFGLSVMARLARQKKRTLLLSLEMSKQAILQRFVSIVSGVDGHAMRAGQLSHSDKVLAGQAIDRLAKWMDLMEVNDRTSLTVGEARSIARRAHRKAPLDCIIVDYLQLMTAPGVRENRQVEVSTISRGIKALARELQVPVICLSQLNRASEHRGSHRPRLSDLRESGSIEQDADLVGLLHREEYYHIDDPEWAVMNPSEIGGAELVIAKQRNGPTGVVKMRWNPQAGRFETRGETQRRGYSSGDDVAFG